MASNARALLLKPVLPLKAEAATCPGANGDVNGYMASNSPAEANAAFESETSNRAKASADANAVIEDPVFAKLRKLALSVSPTYTGISVRALLKHSVEMDDKHAPDNVQPLVQVLGSDEIGPAEFYVIHDSTMSFSVTLASLVNFVATLPNALDTFVWIDVACLPRLVRKTRSMLKDIRSTMTEIGQVVICTSSSAQFSVAKQSWCLYQIHVAQSVGCSLIVYSNDSLDFQTWLYDDLSWDKVSGPIVALRVMIDTLAE
jgi:hypothetical protein